ncbi:MAG: hypothetical protein ABIO79_04580 [Ferruginibacter sp.]
MFKKIMFAAILVITISALKAKNVTPVQYMLPSSSSLGANEDLVNKIAADNDFKNYYISNVKFANKIIGTGAGSLFLKYVQNKITADESAVLFSKMNVSSKKEFDAIAVELRNEAVSFFNKFPELKLRTEKERKELLVSAFKKISTDDLVTIKFVKARLIAPEECFWAWAACSGLCAITCSYNPNYSGCIWDCGGACGGAYGICWLLSE